MSQKVRLQFIDAIKGIAIIIIVLYHILLPSGFKTGITNYMSVFLLIFFCLSGYFYVPGKRNYKQNFIAKAKGLMLPFIKYSLIFWFIGTIYHMIADEMEFTTGVYCLRNFYGGCIWNRSIQDFFEWDYHKLGSLYMFLADFWFLLALMIAFVVFFIFADYALKSSARSIIAMVLLLGIEIALLYFNVVLPYNMHNTPYYVMFLLMGAYFHKINIYESLEKKFSVKVDWIVGIVLLVAGLIGTYFINPVENLFRGTFGEHQIQNMLLVTLVTIVVILGLGIVCRRLELSGLKMKVLCYVGEHSLHILIYHMFFAYFISRFTGIALASAYKDSVPSAGDHAISVLMVLICIALSLAMEYIFRKLTKKS